MGKFLKTLVDNAKKAIDDQNYDLNFTIYKPVLSMKNAIKNCEFVPILGEIKFASPSVGVIREYAYPQNIAVDMIEAGCIGLSVLTQPYLFNGSVDYLANIRMITNAPILMKDIIISEIQVEAAKKIGADCILLIASIFNENLCQNSIDYFTEKAHKLGLEVLLETHTEEEFKLGMETYVDLVGINNRNLDTMNVDIRTTEKILKRCEKKKFVISESGVSQADQIRYLVGIGADAFLIGTSIMQSNSIQDKVRELVMAEVQKKDS